MPTRICGVLVALFLVVGCGGNSSQKNGEGVPVTAQSGGLQINGAGATFPNPIYSKWFAEYERLHPDVRINYQPIGSGGGIRQLSTAWCSSAPRTCR
jgi:ABC-type phosphate transport system substrate-binding protein